MGIAGHMLGPKGLARLNRLAGADFDRAYIRGQACQGRRIEDGVCVHYDVDLATYQLTQAPTTALGGPHWSSCYRDGRLPPPSDLYGGPMDR